jgi:hypothetical protein
MNIYKVQVEDIDCDNNPISNKISVGCKELKQVGDTTLIADGVIIVIEGTIRMVEKTMEE